MEFYRSAFRHGYDEASIRHALDHALVVVEVEPDADPPKMLAVGPDRVANLVEVI